MTEKNERRDDQATELRKLFNEVQGNESANSDASSNNFYSDGEDSQKNQASRDIDILNLPPRKEIHGNKKKRTRVKVSRPFVRFSFVIVIVIILILSIYLLWDNNLVDIPISF